eukprot:XP_801974.4 PREDICTED: zinc finger RNA-binding protein isoform X1 [Strongylocentrotus purpuratus]
MGSQWGGGGYKGMKKGQGFQQQGGNKGPGGGMKETKAPPKPTQLHYCDVCKISCAGPRTYKEHLEGQKHKKKELASKTGTSVNLPSSRSGVQAYRCELCDVSCTGLDAYNAHIRGSKHQKVLKLHTKLGKPIPSSEPVKIGNQATAVTNSTAGTAKTQTTPSKTAPKTAQPIKKMVTPKITFVGGSKLATTGDAEKKNEQKTAQTPAAPAPKTPTTPVIAPTAEDKDDLDMEKDILPVGEDYIEELKNEEGKLVSFNCKLCECQFNDPNAKEMHMKGRRHRLQYKKKVDPSYPVDIKPSARSRKLQEEKLRRQMAKEEFMRQRQEEFQWREEMRRYEEDMYWRRMEEERYWEERRRFEQEMEYFEWQRRRGVHLPRPLPPKPPVPVDAPVMQVKRTETEIDRHVMSKHGSIYPSEQELQLVQNMVSQMEKALKGVSDHIAEEDHPTPPEPVVEETKEPAKTEPATKEGSAAADEKKEEPAKEAPLPPRVLKGVMRIGVLAKGLLLRGALNMGLVILCAEKPTRTLLERIANLLPKHLTEITEEKYEIRLCVEEAGLIVTKEPAMTMTVSLTSPAFRDQPSPDAADSARDPPDVLCRQKCLEALAALRHAKWFQARAGGLQSCVVIIRVLRDLCERVPTWAPLRGWPLELLCERVIASAGQPLSPGDALRRVFEAVAGGLLLPGGPGLFDPCEKDEADALAHLAPQECEDITASAQHALRLIVFRQVHKVLAMEPMYSQNRNFNRNRRNNRKRRMEDSEGGENGDAEGKKDKKEGDTTTSMETGGTEGAGTE